ncbi:MAG: SRPBCC domain-containing protein [Anaerolineales bacterium]
MSSKRTITGHTTTGAAPATPSSDRELVISRIIDAPRERVFEAWTKELPQWWGPHGMTTPVCEMDLRPGGVFRTVMRAPDGTEYPTKGVFLETKYTARALHWTVANREKHEQMGFHQGWGESLDRLVALVTKA